MAEFHYRVAILTASDKGSRGERVDESGPLIRQIIENAGYQVGDYLILPDEQEQITDQLRRWSEGGQIDLILTTGGTGFSPRDCRCYFFCHVTGTGAWRRTAMHSARMLTAISSGVSAPMSRPMGAWMRARSCSVNPDSSSPA